MTMNNTIRRSPITLGNLNLSESAAALTTDEMRQVRGGHLYFGPSPVRCVTGFASHVGLFNLYPLLSSPKTHVRLCRRGPIRFGRHSLLPLR